MYYASQVLGIILSFKNNTSMLKLLDQIPHAEEMALNAFTMR